MREKDSVPAVRFDGFTDDWEQHKLFEYLEVSCEKNRDVIYTKKDVLSVSGDYGIVNQIEFQGRSFAGESVSNYGVVHTGDVVYTKSPLNSNPYGIIKVNKGKSGIVSTLYAVYHPRENVNSEFIQIYFEQHARMNNYMHPLVNKGAKNDMKVSAENALKNDVIFPEIEEQQQIVQLFRQLDHLITLHQRKYSRLCNIKKFMLERMFPREGTNVPEIRFAGFTDVWEQRKLEDCSELITKGTTPSCFSEDGCVTFIKIEALKEKRVIKELCSAISEEIHKGELARSILKENDIVFAIAGATVGKCAIITGNILPANTNQALAIIRLKPNINRDFVYFSLTSKQMEMYINQSKSVGAQPNLSLAQMNAFKFLCPCREEEQQKIGDYFSALDCLINLHQRELERLRNIKKACLEKMFV